MEEGLFDQEAMLLVYACACAVRGGGGGSSIRSAGDGFAAAAVSKRQSLSRVDI